MKLALLGTNFESFGFLRAIVDDKQHELVSVYMSGQHADDVRQLVPDATLNDEWESLLSGNVADAVIVAGARDDDMLQDQLRKLVQAAVPLLIVHPICPSIVAYELDMIRQDTDCVMLPFIPGSLHPGVWHVQEIARQETGSSIGDIEQLVIERSLQERSREGVLMHLARDAELVRMILGDVKCVSAIRAAGDRSYENLSIQMTSKDDILARWSIVPGDAESNATLRVIGERGRISLLMPGNGKDWSLERSGDEQFEQTYEDFDEYACAVNVLTKAIGGEEPQPNWPQACHDLEVVSAVEQSVRRGRTIEILDEEHSEEQTFKGIMAIGGCSILLATLLLLLGLAVFEGLTLPLRDPVKVNLDDGPPDPVPRAHILLRLWPFYPFVAFLLLQLLRLVFNSPPSRPAAEVEVDQATNSAV